MKKSECRELCELLTSTSEDKESFAGSPTDLLDTEIDLIDEVNFEELLDQKDISVPDLSKF